MLKKIQLWIWVRAAVARENTQYLLFKKTIRKLCNIVLWCIGCVLLEKNSNSVLVTPSWKKNKTLKKYSEFQSVSKTLAVDC